MAKASKRSKGAKAKQAAKDHMRIKAAIALPDEAHPQYVNFAEVSHSHNEFGISFAHVPSRMSPARTQLAQQTGQIQLEPSVVLVVPPTLIPGLINALTKQRAAYEQAFGKIYTSGGDKDDGSD